ncbi:glycosyltransferase family 39 protein [Aquifex pyrophilus]
MKKKLVFFLPLVFLYFFNLGYNAVWIPNESFYADASKNMVETGNYLTPVYNGELRLNKPPLTYWLSALGFKIFGINEFGLRFFQAFLGILTGVLTYLVSKKLTKKEDVSLLSALILNLSFIFIANARYTSPEVPFTFFITLSLYLWLEYYTEKKNLFFLLALVSSSLAVLTKGPAGFALPAGVIFFYLLFNDPKELLKIRYYLGTAFVFIAGGWWFLYQYFANKEVFLEVFIKENIKRIYALQKDPIYFYALDINVSFLPYSLLFFPAVFWAFRKKELRFPLTWFLFIFTLFSLVKMKIPVYIMPAYPAMAVITAHFLLSSEMRKVKVFLSLLLGTLISLALILSAVYIKMSLFIIPLIFLAFIPAFTRRFILFPAFAGFAFLLYLSSVILPFVEEYRPYREIGRAIKDIDPSGKLKTYEVGFFHHNLPFYADRVVIRNKSLSEIKEGLILVRSDLSECEGIKSWKLYTSSESRFFKFLMDIKRGKRFREFKLCILTQGRLKSR